jgi:hypothetical protein
MVADLPFFGGLIFGPPLALLDCSADVDHARVEADVVDLSAHRAPTSCASAADLPRTAHGHGPLTSTGDVSAEGAPAAEQVLLLLPVAERKTASVRPSNEASDSARRFATRIADRRRRRRSCSPPFARSSSVAPGEDPPPDADRTRRDPYGVAAIWLPPGHGGR